MHCNIYDVFYSLHFEEHVSVGDAAILRVMLLLQEYKSANVLAVSHSLPNNEKLL
jgi:hypothetical protein